MRYGVVEVTTSLPFIPGWMVQRYEGASLLQLHLPGVAGGERGRVGQVRLIVKGDGVWDGARVRPLNDVSHMERLRCWTELELIGCSDVLRRRAQADASDPDAWTRARARSRTTAVAAGGERNQRAAPQGDAKREAAQSLRHRASCRCLSWSWGPAATVVGS